MISPKSLMKIATTASVVAMTVSVAVVPAYAMQDIAIEDAPSSFAATVDDAQNSSNSMPDNPNAMLGAADVFLEIITQPFLGSDGIVPDSSNRATV